MPDSSDWSAGFIAVDWGTTNRRAWAVEPDGKTRELLEDALGVLKIDPGGFPFEIEAIRKAHGAKPMLLAGMIGSNRGWIEAPYVPGPATLDQIVAAMHWPEANV